jgi:hypothetical protein
MSSTPLILYRAGSLDAEAAKELLLERFPGAEARPLDGGAIPMWFKQRGQHAWCLNLPGDRPADDLYHPVNPTPDASMAMQMWRLLQPDRPTFPCETAGPPRWLRYLDDAVCGRWESRDTPALWAFWEHRIAVAGADVLAAYLVRCDELPGVWFTVGRALVSERKRWEKETKATLAAAAVAGSLGADMFEMVRRERDQLRTKLREALDHLYRPEAVAEMSREEWLEWWRPACGLAGVGDPDDDTGAA